MSFVPLFPSLRNSTQFSGLMFHEYSSGCACLKDRGQTLEAQAGVDVLVGEVLEAAVALPIVLNEHHIPDLQVTKTKQATAKSMT